MSAQQLIDNCDRCHSSEIDNAALAIPKINGQDREYLARVLRAYRDDRRESSMMHKDDSALQRHDDFGRRIRLRESSCELAPPDYPIRR